MIPVWRKGNWVIRWENCESGSRVNDSRSLTNHLSKQEVG